MNGPDLLNLLRSGDIDPLHTHLSDLQAQFEAGKLHERDLLRAFQPFQTSDLTLSDGFQKWTETHPGTYAPHVALANWFLGRGWEARGGHTSNRVSDQGWRSLDHFLTQTDGCARHAATLTDNPLAAWNVIGLASNTRGCQLSLHDVQTQQYPDWFTRGVADNPGSVALRRVMLLHLRTEWGGSEEHMLTFVRQQQDAGQLGQTDMQRLWAEFHSHVAHHAQHFARDPDRAIERASLAADLYPPKAEQLFIALTNAASPGPARLAALRRFLTAAEQDPAVSLSGNFYWALAKAGSWIQPQLPALHTLIARELHQGDAQGAVSVARLRHRHPTWKLPDPLPALRVARDQGHTEAAEEIVYAAGPSISDTEVRGDILKAADLLSGDMSWRVYQDFPAYQQQFNLTARQRFKYLHRAADGGNNDARVELAQQLRAGKVELGGDGVLRPVDTPPLQSSLDYARHLLERAVAVDHEPARHLLNDTAEQEWNADQATRLAPSVQKPAAARSHWWDGWWKVMLVLAGLRLLAALFGHH
ncbi:hypothetical protein GCM10008959_08170 [Deinococcus seoulensis]|uniref:DUF4034 domain-containing protein n=1 Tax=Deinococcus seoulensis TaxID=1837379 RepID=A0ABQ2RRC0_9DEIO|nr:hypothetical protein [Deinococcus seoulensis]GGR49303.1 hypothetical protein GCM10008959_08170 [Deinococcus seoulensis]